MIPTDANENELLFKNVGACRLSKMGNALNIHLNETNEYLSIPLTDIKAIIFEQMAYGNECKMPTIGTVRRYQNVKQKEQTKKKKGDD